MHHLRFLCVVTVQLYGCDPLDTRTMLNTKLLVCKFHELIARFCLVSWNKMLFSIESRHFHCEPDNVQFHGVSLAPTTNMFKDWRALFCVAKLVQIVLLVRKEPGRLRARAHCPRAPLPREAYKNLDIVVSRPRLGWHLGGGTPAGGGARVLVRANTSSLTRAARPSLL